MNEWCCAEGRRSCINWLRQYVEMGSVHGPINVDYISGVMTVSHNAEYGGASCQTDNGANLADRTFSSGDEEHENIKGSRINQTTAGEEIRLNI